MSHRPRKRFGQHFLRDAGIIEKIISAVNPQASDTVVEIGPGEGVLTRLLADAVDNLHVIEIDRDLARRLRTQYADRPGVQVHEGDALKTDIADLGENLRVIGNLPYNISTPLLFHMLAQREHISDMHFMLQKDVVDRIVASPNNKKYGRLTVMLGLELCCERLFDVSAEAFYPPPKVESSVIRLLARPTPLSLISRAGFATLVSAAFSQRRKTLRNSLKKFANDEIFLAAEIDSGDRAENLSIEKYVRLANLVANNEVL